MLKVSAESFAYEILEDLPALLAESPTGVTMHQLHEYYNESPARILRAIHLLEQRHRIKVYQAPSKSIYILLPEAIPLPFGLNGLSDLQRRVMMYLLDICQKANTNAVRTNYSQLSRILECSATGIRTCIDRLVQLEYLEIVNPSAHGKQAELVIKLGKQINDQRNTS